MGGTRLGHLPAGPPLHSYYSQYPGLRLQSIILCVGCGKSYHCYWPLKGSLPYIASHHGPACSAQHSTYNKPKSSTTCQSTTNEASNDHPQNLMRPASARTRLEQQQLLLLPPPPPIILRRRRLLPLLLQLLQLLLRLRLRLRLLLRLLLVHYHYTSNSLRKHCYYTATTATAATTNCQLPTAKC